MILMKHLEIAVNWSVQIDLVYKLTRRFLAQNSWLDRLIYTVIDRLLKIQLATVTLVFTISASAFGNDVRYKT